MVDVECVWGRVQDKYKVNKGKEVKMKRGVNQCWWSTWEGVARIREIDLDLLEIRWRADRAARLGRCRFRAALAAPEASTLLLLAHAAAALLPTAWAAAVRSASAMNRGGDAAQCMGVIANQARR